MTSDLDLQIENSDQTTNQPTELQIEGRAYIHVGCKNCLVMIMIPNG